MIARGLWKTQGATPEATVNSVIAVEIKRRGAASVFQRVAPGVYALRKWGLSEQPSANRARTAAPAAPLKSSPAIAASMSFSDAAEKVLEQFGGKKPMHYRAITARALELGFIRTEGKRLKRRSMLRFLPRLRA